MEESPGREPRTHLVTSFSKPTARLGSRDAARKNSHRASRPRLGSVISLLAFVRLGLHAGLCPSVALSLCPCPVLLLPPGSLSLFVPLCLDHREGQGTLASSSPLHRPSANSPADALHLLLGSQPPSRCRPANRKATAERKAEARPPAAPSASQKQGQSLSASRTRCMRQMLRGQSRGRGNCG